VCGSPRTASRGTERGARARCRTKRQATTRTRGAWAGGGKSDWKLAAAQASTVRVTKSGPAGEGACEKLVKVGKFGNALVRPTAAQWGEPPHKRAAAAAHDAGTSSALVRFDSNLTGGPATRPRDAETSAGLCVGGMRHPRSVVARTPGMSRGRGAGARDP